tara:strand:+ start:39990 stop:42665 length:2676 start_codon:yes stop_codon:yes gene_type:complete
MYNYTNKILFKKICKIVFYTFFFMLEAVSAQDISLDKKITININNESIFVVLDKIEIKENCFFSYDASIIKNKEKLSKNFTNISLRSILNELFKEYTVDYYVKKNVIYIKKRSKKLEIRGEIVDSKGSPVPFASVILKNIRSGTSSNENGRFVFKNLQKGIYKIITSTVGFKTNIRTIEISKDVYLNIVLIEKIESLTDIIVYSKSESKKQSEKAITITSLNIKELKDQAIGTEEVLKTATGVIIRQNGGLGSNTQINLNGLTGNAVRIYFDGIPLQVYGNGMQPNNIPVDALERIDVYKGVMPLDIGTDALGGGINLIPLRQSRNYFRTSYSFGSFNTHRVTFNGLKKINDKIAISTISYFNYSDNNYKMRNIPNLIVTEKPNLLNPDKPFQVATEERINTRRFHDQHISGFIEVKLSVTDLKWADRLDYSSSYTKKEDEIQHGSFITNTAIGEVTTDVTAFSQRIDYRKTFFEDKLKVRYYGVLSHALDKVNDSSTNKYNWRGEVLNLNNETGAEFGAATLRERENLSTAHRFRLNYKLTEHIDFNLSDFYRYTKIQGKDPLAEPQIINNVPTDLNTIPSSVNRNVFGAGLDGDFFEDTLNTIIFYKNYYYKAEAIDIFRIGGTIVPISETQNITNGYGFALKYQINRNFFIRTSFEQAIRIPTETEIFGNLSTILPNFQLEPEESLNWNIGAQFEKRFKNNKLFSVNINGFVRDQKNLIRAQQVSIDRVQFKNEALVNGKGVELTLKIIPLKNLALKGNFTYQSNEIVSNDDGPTGIQVPNTPLNFYNISANYNIENLLKSENDLQLFWTYFFTDKFSINEVTNLDTANTDFIIPVQNVHNAGATYSIKNKGLAFSFNLQNVFNAHVFDNFRIPRPGINYAFKINYSL